MLKIIFRFQKRFEKKYPGIIDSCIDAQTRQDYIVDSAADVMDLPNKYQRW